MQTDTKNLRRLVALPASSVTLIEILQATFIKTTVNENYWWSSDYILCRKMF